jgi:proteasome lid subunit RPN8/RPN11
MGRPKLLANQLQTAIREARAAARRDEEICGLLVNNGHFLELVPVRNRARRRGGFNLDQQQTRRLQTAIRELDREIVGTYHSHPISDSRPGRSDIDNAFDGDLMLVIDCLGREATLWRITGHHARRVGFDAVDLAPRRKVLPNKRLQRTNAAATSGIGASRRRGTVAFAAEAQSR